MTLHSESNSQDSQHFAAALPRRCRANIARISRGCCVAVNMARTQHDFRTLSALLLLLLAISVKLTVRYQNHSQSSGRIALSTVRGQWQSLGELFYIVGGSLVLMLLHNSLDQHCRLLERWLRQHSFAVWVLLGCAAVICSIVASARGSSSLGIARLASDPALPPHCSSLLSAEPCAIAWWVLFAVLGLAPAALLW